MLHVYIIILHVDIDKSHVNLISCMFHVDIIYHACKGQNLTGIQVHIHYWYMYIGTVHTNAGSCDPSEDEISEGYKEFIGKKAIEDLIKYKIIHRLNLL